LAEEGSILVDFRILGPLVVEVDRRELTVAAPRQRVVLAALLLNANQVVSVDRIGGFVWDDTPPRSGPAVIRTYVMRLRQALGPKAAARIITRTPGYLIEVDEQETDLGRFNSHRDKAGALAGAGDLEGASAELRDALSIWRQEPLQDIHSRTLRDIEVRHLEERYLQTLSWRLDLDLQLGRHTDLIPELWRLTREHPLREGLVARLMLALFRSGRQFDALNVFHQTRALLIEQLATEPGAELQGMQQRILAADDAQPTRSGPATVRQTVRTASPLQPRPAQLPAVLPDFVAWLPLDTEPGGTGSFNWLSGEPAPDPAITTVISGGGGVGKSSLAVHTAHACRKEFTCGQLYASLGGSGRQPAEPADVLARFLRDLGVSRAAIPHDEAELAATYRSVVADRKLLIVLDDARSAAQVRPLIPGDAGSRVIITSRNRLAGLEGARTLVLRRMTEENSLRLLGTIVGRARVDADLPAARKIVRICGGLPLAVRIVGIRLLGQPHRPLVDVARRLEMPDRLLDELSVGDLAVRDCFDAGYAALSTPLGYGVSQDLVLRTLGTLDTATFTAATVAERLGCTSIEAEDALDRFVEANLLDQDGPGRYLLHDVARAYAREQTLVVYGPTPQLA
jgi:DNA-binding SARP family transcriptional activator